MDLTGKNSVTETPHIHECGSSCLVHGTGFATDWSADEQRVLEDGLKKYANELPFMKYLKIAALLVDKTALDVAMRSHWMKNKRQNPNQPTEGGTMTMRENKRQKPNQPTEGGTMTMKKEAQPNENLPTAKRLNRVQHFHLSLNVNDPIEHPGTYLSHNVNHPIEHPGTHLSHNVNHPIEHPGTGLIHQLLGVNDELFSRIAGNISTCKLQENLKLFSRTRHNIITMYCNLPEQPELPESIWPMPPLPLSINENLANFVLRIPSHVLMQAVVHK